MIPVHFPEANRRLGMTQDQYEPIHAYKHPGEEGRVTCCFRLSPTELEEIARTGTLWLQQLTFDRTFAPIRLSIMRPDDLPKEA